MWPLQVTWAPLQHGHVVLRVNTLKKRELSRNCIAFYDLALEAMQCHFNHILFVGAGVKTTQDLDGRTARLGRGEKELLSNE